MEILSNSKISNIFRGIVEITPLYEYGKILQNELKIEKYEDKCEDLKSKEMLSTSSIEPKINKYRKSIDKIKEKQKILYGDYSNSPPKEVIVTFFRLRYKNECLHDYSKYSHWYSRASSLPNEMRLRQKYSFKVTGAPEPLEVNLE